MKRVLVLLSVAAGLMAPSAPAASPALSLDRHQINFGSQPFGSLTVESFSVTNTSPKPLYVRIDQVQVWDDFSPGLIESTCTLTDERVLAPGESCTHFVSFRPSEFFAGRETSLLRVVARNDAGATVYTRDVRLVGRAVAPR
jgi:hypothetical protein